jgi:hypothetical protein
MVVLSFLAASFLLTLSSPSLPQHAQPQPQELELTKQQQRSEKICPLINNNVGSDFASSGFTSFLCKGRRDGDGGEWMKHLPSSPLTTSFLVDVPSFSKERSDEVSTLSHIFITSTENIHLHPHERLESGKYGYNQAEQTPLSDSSFSPGSSYSSSDSSSSSSERSSLEQWVRAKPGTRVIAHRYDIKPSNRAYVTDVLDGNGPWRASLKKDGPVRVHNKTAEAAAAAAENDKNEEEVIVVFTPGQTSGSLCVIVPWLRACFSGNSIPTLMYTGGSAEGDALIQFASNRGGVTKQASSIEKLANEYCGGGSEGEQGAKGHSYFDVLYPSKGDVLELEEGKGKNDGRGFLLKNLAKKLRSLAGKEGD